MKKFLRKFWNHKSKSDNREETTNPINLPTSSTRDESLAVNALTDKNFGAYERLLLQGCTPISGELRKKIVQKFSDQEKSKVRDIYLNCSVKSYLSTVKAKCELDHAELLENRDNFFGLIYEAIDKLNKCKECQLIIRIIALSETLQIVFDLNRNSINFIDPTKNENTQGFCYYNRNKIIIGAKGLQDNTPSQISLVMGVIIHEFCHLALQLLYGNGSKPYTSLDDANEKKFKGVLEECETKQTVEKLVASVFMNPKEEWHAELIVRVVQMMAFYSNDQAKIEELKGVYPQLFRYFKDKIVVDLEDENNIKIVEARLKLRGVNQTCELFDTLRKYFFPFVPESLEGMFPPQFSSQSTILTSNWVEGTLKGIFTKFEEQKEFDGKLFMEMKHFKDSQKAEKAFDAMKRYNVTVVVKCETANEKEIQDSIKQIINNNPETKMIFVAANDVKFKTLKPHKVQNPWNQLTEKYQNWFLKKKASFQGHKVALSEILNLNSLAANELNLNDLFIGKIMEIGEKLEEVKIHIERKFERLDAENNDHEVFSLAEVLLDMTENQVFLLAADAGCGKSTELKFIANELKKKNPSLWIVYIDLKKYTESFQEDGEVSMSFECPEIAEYFTENILMLKGVHEKMFVELFEKNRVVFLFDGVDEISPSYKEFVLELIATINTETQNQIWIATRKHMVQDLEEKNLTTNAYTMVDFSEDDREGFFVEALDTCSDDDKKVILEKVRDFLNNIYTVSWGDSKHMIANVQLLTMIVALFKKNKNFKSSGYNLFSIYSDFVKEFTQNLSGKGFDAGEDLYSFTQTLNAKKYRQKKSFEIISLDNTDIEELASEIFQNVKKPTNEKITRTGLISNDGTENLYFIHRTFSEFFVAEYFYEKFFVEEEECVNAKTVAKLFYSVIEDDFQGMVRRFLNEKLENFKKSKLTASKVLKEAIKNDVDEIDCDIMILLIADGSFNIIKFIFLLFHDQKEMLDFWIRQEVLVYSSAFDLFDATLKLWSLAENLFNEDQKRIILVTEDTLGRNILNHNIDFEAFAFFVEKGRVLLDRATIEYENFFTPKVHLWKFDERFLLQNLSRSQECLEKDEFSRLVESYENADQFLKLTPEKQELMHCIINDFLDSH